MMGGVKTDIWGRTSVRGLYAAGETADTGVHGANRLASNSLLEGLVFGARSGQSMSKDFPASKSKHSALPGSPAPKPGAPAAEAHAVKSNAAQPGSSSAAAATQTAPADSALAKIRDLMWRHVGILRGGKELSAAIEFLEKTDLPLPPHPGRHDYELRNLHSLALLMARSALAREESRGSHYRSDFPYRDDDDFQKHSLIQRGKDVTFEP